jgi:hypothetical protein
LRGAAQRANQQLPAVRICSRTEARTKTGLPFDQLIRPAALIVREAARCYAPGMRRKPAKKKASSKKSSSKKLATKKTVKKSAPRTKPARSKAASARIHQGVSAAEPARELETAPEPPEEIGEEAGEEAEYGGES